MASSLKDFEELITTHLKIGTKVEISSNDDGFRGSFFTGTILKDLKKSRSSTNYSTNRKVLVQYDTIFKDDSGKNQLSEEVNVVQVRPIPPREITRSFKISEEVDAYHNEGWWEGVVTEVLEGEKYFVFFRANREQLKFHAKDLRLHREWVKGIWEPPLEPPQLINNNGESQQKEVMSRKACDYKYSLGEVIEVSSDEDGYEGAWFAAKVVELLHNGNYLVEYAHLRNDEDTEFVREEVDSQHIRPPPPHISVDRFDVLQSVDALLNDGWWTGVVFRVLSIRKYVVYFNNTNEKLEFKHSDLRPHQDWIDDKWVIPPKAVKF